MKRTIILVLTAITLSGCNQTKNLTKNKSEKTEITAATACKAEKQKKYKTSQNNDNKRIRLTEREFYLD